MRRGLRSEIKVQLVERTFLPNFLIGPFDIVVPIGQDGMVANTAKYALGRPIIGVNPDPARFDGVLLPFNQHTAVKAIENAVEGRINIKTVTLAEARLEDGQRLLAFNDLFIGNRTHVSARYRIEVGGQTENHSSSGVLISTGAGSTGWLSSVYNMAAGIGNRSRKQQPGPPAMEWDDSRLCYVVREPFASKVTQTGLVSGLLDSGEPLILESNMPTNGVIFSDGIESDNLAFNAGAIARITTAEERALLVV